MAPESPLRLLLRVIPRASREGWGGRRGERLVVHLTVAPTDGKANARLKKFLAAEFGTSASAVTIERGEHSREKTVRIDSPRRVPEPFRQEEDAS
ncbi:MAG: DUF167 domain-containing protein [Pseudomonadales bacterium]